MAFTGGSYSRSGVIKTYLVASVGGGGYKGGWVCGIRGVFRWLADCGYMGVQAVVM